MDMRMKRASLFLVALGSVTGCKDRAEPNYASCVQAEAAQDFERAWGECNAAVHSDPNSTSGKAAAAKLVDLKPKYDKWKKEKAEADAKAAEERRKQEEANKKAELDSLRAKIACIRTDEDDHCVSEGKPPKGRECKGSTYEENERFATLKGCVHSHYVPTSTPPSYTFNLFCCPD